MNNIKILIVDDDNSELMIIKEFVKELNYELFTATNGKDGYEIALKEKPNLIITDIYMPKYDGFYLIDSINSNESIKTTPILVITNQDDEKTKERSISLRIHGILLKPFTKDELILKIEKIVLSEALYLNSYTNRFIRSFVKLNNCTRTATNLISIAKIVTHKFEIDSEQTFDIKQVLAILSLAIENFSVTKLIRFYKEMDFAKHLLEILENFQRPRNCMEEVVFVIFKLYTVRNNKQQLKDIKLKVDNMLLEFTKNVYLTNATCLETGVDMEIVWDKLSKLFSDKKDIDLMDMDAFLKKADRILRYVLINHEGGMVQIIDDEKYVSLQITPRKNKESDNILNIFKIENNKISFIKSKNQFGDSFILSLDKSVNSDSNTFTDFSNVNSTCSIKKEKKETLDAATYLNTNEIDFNDIYYLTDLENEIFDILSTIEISKRKKDDILKILNYIRKYATTILYFPQFSDLSSWLLNLANVTVELEKSDSEIDEDRLSLLLEYLMKDLKSWKDEIFVNLNTVDVHFLDDSIIASCQQCIG
ncbi:MAG: response regulator, partial [Campylobacterales bacterium]|nr:response regulator [Campylobacterales bacterium]